MRMISFCEKPKTRVSDPCYKGVEWRGVDYDVLICLAWINGFLVSRGRLKDWHRIAATIPGRNNKDCRKRWCKINGETKKGLWDPDEDDRLQAGVHMHGFRYSSTVSGHKA